MFSLSGELVLEKSPPPLYTDMFGDTLPLGNKIYAIRAPAESSPKQIREQPRTVGIVFNWKNVIGFRRAGDNAKAFPINHALALEQAYLAAQEFMSRPSVHEGPLVTKRFVLSTRSTSTKCVLISILVSVILLGAYYCVLLAQEWYGCVYSTKLFGKSVGSGISDTCRHLLRFQLHVQDNASTYTEMFFSQLKILLVLAIRYVIDELFSS